MSSHHQADQPGEAVAAAAARHLFAAGVMSHAGHANSSVRLASDRFALTTTGMVRDLCPDQIATLDLDGRILGGELSPENAEIRESMASVRS